MKIKDLSTKNIELLLELDKRKSITSREQRIYGGLGFYGAKKFLIARGLIKNSTEQKGTERSIELTDKGMKVVSLLKELDKIPQEDSP